MPTPGPKRPLLRRIGRRGGFLLFLALLDMIYAYGLITPTARSAQNPTTVFLSSVLPLEAWAGLWGMVGALCLFYAFRQQDFPGYFAAMFLKVLWAGTFLMGWLFAGVERGYLSFAIWGAFGGVLALIAGWKENWERERGQ